MAKHKNFKIAESEKLGPLEKGIAAQLGTDMVDWPEGFLEVYLENVFLAFDRENGPDSDWDIRGKKIDLEGFETGRPTYSQIGKIISEKLLNRDVKFFEMLHRLVECDTPVEPLRYSLSQYFCKIVSGDCPPPISLEDIRRELPLEVRKNVLDDKTLRKAAKACYVWPPEVAQNAADLGKEEIEGK